MSAFQSAKVWTVTTPSQSRPRPVRPLVPKRTERPRRKTVDSRERSARNERIAVWARLGAVGLLAAAILWWPYARTCGVGLATYLAAASVIIIGGVWVVACTWIVRMPRTHAVAMLLMLWGLALIAVEVLPRVGYAKADAAHPPIWWCAA